MQKTPISPDQRLNIAAMILAGLQAPGYAVDTPERRAAIRESAIKQTDELIEACDCQVAIDPYVDFFDNAKGGFLIPTGSAEGYKHVDFQQVPLRFEDSDEAHKIANQRD